VTLTLPLLVALGVVALLTAGGTAVRLVSRIWLRHWAERRLRGSVAAVMYLERPHRLLTAAGAGVALTLVVAGMSLGTTGGVSGVLLASIVFAGLVVLAGQLVPRAMARRWPSGVAAATLPVLRIADLVTMPLVSVGRAAARLVVRQKPPVPAPEERDPIQELLREGELEGIGEREEIAIISGVVEFSEKVVKDVMTPRSDMFALPDGVDPHTLAAQIAQSRYSRVPIYHGTLDQIIGMVHAFDVIKARGDVAERLRPVTFSAPGAPCNELLFRMLRERVHLAVVRDESGHALGLVTLEDLLEELVGDIRDEHDEPEPPRQVKPGAP
jgi:putative hemolysin